jgi:hypothetical protein
VLLGSLTNGQTCTYTLPVNDTPLTLTLDAMSWLVQILTARLKEDQLPHLRFPIYDFGYLRDAEPMRI